MSLISKFNSSRKFIPPGFAWEYSLETELKKGALSRLIDGCLRKVVPASVFGNRPIQDFKGRDALNLINSEISPEQKPSGDEIIFLSGLIFTAEDQAELPFEIRVNSVFKEFVGAHHITHSINIERRGEIPREIPVEYMGIVFPIQITRFRLGIDVFQSHMFAGMLGFAPVVNQTLLIECTQEQLKLQISADSLKSKEQIPFAFENIYEHLEQTMQSALGISIIKDISALQN